MLETVAGKFPIRSSTWRFSSLASLLGGIALGLANCISGALLGGKPFEGCDEAFIIGR
jgi:hypothetical protein